MFRLKKTAALLVSAVALSATALSGEAVSTELPAAQAAGYPSCDSAKSERNPVTGQVITYPINMRATNRMDCVAGIGAWGDHVQAIQLAANNCHAHKPALTVDKDYGTKTADAVWSIQDKGNITADGVYGPDTRMVMKFAPACLYTWREA
ncbi:MAG: peptidoglycan-binding protein [Bifidobacteriaceae bacterium]|jgi:peptidoglycan hydrolase-like protein with peptidoglycan-binding domain|nr:peptidoglycan-binding protein [Bifidobacteriaceae bacterium]